MFPPRHHVLNTQRGFTLIEILVVIVILSITISVVIVNFAPDDADDIAEEEISRLQMLLAFSHEQAVIRGREYGIRFYKSGYRFMLYDDTDEDWTDIPNDRLLVSRQFDESLELHLYIDQLPVEILDSQDDDPVNDDDEENKLASAASLALSDNNSAQEKARPQVFLLSSSEVTPQFDLHLRIPGSDIEKVLQGLADGSFVRGDEDE